MVELYNDKNSVTSEQIEEAHKLEIDMPGNCHHLCCVVGG